MADEPTSPQQLIDTAAQSLNVVPPANPLVVETPPPEPPPLPPTPETLIIPSKEKEKEKPPEKTKKGKGGLLAVLLFLVLTLPVGVYYGFQQYQQITEGRSKAATPVPTTPPSQCAQYPNMVGCEYYKGFKPTAAPTARPTTTYVPPTRNEICQADPAFCRFPTAVPTINQTTYVRPTIPPQYGKDSFYEECMPKTLSATDLNTCANLSGIFCSNQGSSCCDPIATTCPAPGAAPTAKPALPGGKVGCPGIKSYNDDSKSTCQYYKNNVPNGTGEFNGGCVFYHCPNGCSANGKCDETSPGYRIEFGICNSGRLGEDECGQIDTVDDNGRYCEVPGCGALVQCGGAKCAYQGGGNTTNETNTIVDETTPTEIPTPTTITSTNAPGTCDASCDADTNCQSGLSCVTVTGIKRCRIAACPNESNCNCPSATATIAPTTVYTYNRNTFVASNPTTIPTQQPTPKVPVSGTVNVQAIITAIGAVILIALGILL